MLFALLRRRSLLFDAASVHRFKSATCRGHEVREKFRERKLAKGLSLHIYTSFISSFLTAVFSLPIDLVKTKYQVKRRGIQMSEIFSDILHKKGIWYFWKGFVPYYVRMAIHTTVSLLIFDKIYMTYDTH